MNNIELEKRVKQIVHNNQYMQGYADMVTTIQELGYLNQQDFHAWRQGKVRFLEQVCKVNLSKLTLVSKFLRRHADQLKLKPSITIIKFKGQRLQYSKSGKRSIEDHYATRYINSELMKELKEQK